VREELRTYTGLDGERLDVLVDELEVKITDIARYAKMRRAFDRPAETAQEYAELAALVGPLISRLHRANPIVRELMRLPTSQLVHALKVAEDGAAALRKYVTKGPPVVRPYRDGLARGAVRIIRTHCPGINKPNLRRAVYVALKNASYDSPNPKKDSKKFDQMTQPFPPDPINEAAEHAARVLKERLRDVPI